MPALRRQIDVGQRSLPPPGSSAGSTEIVVAGRVVQTDPIDVVLRWRIETGRVSEAQNRTNFEILLSAHNRVLEFIYIFSSFQIYLFLHLNKVMVIEYVIILFICKVPYTNQVYYTNISKQQTTPAAECGFLLM